MAADHDGTIPDVVARNSYGQQLAPRIRNRAPTTSYLWLIVMALVVAILLGFSCWGTYRITKQLILDDVGEQYRDAVEFDDRKAPLIEFVHSHKLSDEELLRGDSLPKSLVASRVCSVCKRGRFVFFKLVSRSTIPTLDAADSYFVYDLDQSGRAIEDLIAMEGGSKTTCHVAYLRTRGWHYWVTDFDVENLLLPQ